MVVYEFDDYSIRRIEIAFSDLPWNCDSDDPYPNCLKQLLKKRWLHLFELLELKEELENIITRSIRACILDDVILEDHLDNAECAIECLRYVKKTFDRFSFKTRQNKMTHIDWHPYPEETPQSGDNYLVTVIDQTDHKTRYVGTALFLNVTGWNVSSRYRVIAWANLPEPDSRTVE